MTKVLILFKNLKKLKKNLIGYQFLTEFEFIIKCPAFSFLYTFIYKIDKMYSQSRYENLAGLGSMEAEPVCAFYANR